MADEWLQQSTTTTAHPCPISDIQQRICQSNKDLALKKIQTVLKTVLEHPIAKRHQWMALAKDSYAIVKRPIDRQVVYCVVLGKTCKGNECDEIEFCLKPDRREALELSVAHYHPYDRFCYLRDSHTVHHDIFIMLQGVRWLSNLHVWLHQKISSKGGEEGSWWSLDEIKRCHEWKELEDTNTIMKFIVLLMRSLDRRKTIRTTDSPV